MILKHLKRFAHAFSGLYYALRHDLGFAINFFGGGLFIGIIMYFYSPLSSTELLFLVGAWALVLITEMQNSSLEHALDTLHPQLHEQIGKSKDMASASVLLAGFFALAVVVAIIFF